MEAKTRNLNLYLSEENIILDNFTLSGPFVMNTQEDIQKTFRDYQLGKNGFENAPKWQSDYVKNRE